MTTKTVTLKNTFLRYVSTPEPMRQAAATKTTTTYEMTKREFDIVEQIAKNIDGYVDGDATKLEVANARRAAEGALRALGEWDVVEPEPAVTATPSALYDTLYTAFDFFNDKLFSGKLPPVVIVLHRKRNAAGYFWNGMWQRKGTKGKLSEIALTPDTMDRSPEKVLSTLVHEMVHHEQHVFGKPGVVHHNQEWAEWMKRIGLQPVAVGSNSTKKDGTKKETGMHVTHEIVADGPFAEACAELLKKNSIDLGWFSRAPRSAKKQDSSKVKHTCSVCGTNIWGAHSEKKRIAVYCCEKRMQPVFYA